MPKQGKQALQDALASRSPLGQRQAIVPVNILEEAALTPPLPDAKTEREKDTEKASNIGERKKRVIKANAITNRKERTEKASSKSEHQNRTILAEPEKPETVRDSYEAYVDQLETIEILRALYRKKIGRPLSKSRIIREALANFLPLALDAYKDEQSSP
jgi:hypothetical protein